MWALIYYKLGLSLFALIHEISCIDSVLLRVNFDYALLVGTNKLAESHAWVPYMATFNAYLVAYVPKCRTFLRAILPVCQAYMQCVQNID